MNLRQTLAMLVVLTALIAAVAILGTHLARRGRDTAVAETPVDWSEVRDDPGQRLEITWLGSTSFAGASEGSYVERLLEREYNIELKPIFLDANAYVRKKGLMYAGGKVPDVCLDSFVQADARHGFLLELPYEVLMRHAPNWVAEVNRVAPNAWLPMNYQGRNYGLPTVYLNGVYPGPGIWRMDWLENVGINRIPDTLDEMFEALRRITFEDPDRNGRDDTYGMSNDIQDFWWTAFAEIFGAFDVLPFDWMERDGEIVWGGTLPETREALALLRDWYAAGVIDPEFVTDRTSSPGGLQHKFMNGRIGYIYYIGRYETLDTTRENSLINKLQTLNPGATLAVARFPSGPRGDRGGRVHGPDGGGGITFGRHLAQQPMKVIRVLHMLDRMIADEDFHIETKAGRHGRHWDYRDPEIGPNSGMRFLPPFDEGQTATLNVLSLFLNGASFFNPTSAPLAISRKYTSRAELRFNETYRKLRWAMIDVLGKPAYPPSAPRYLPDLRIAQLRFYAEVIRGDRPLDDFDAFNGEWNQRGGDILTREANQLYQLKLRIFDRLGIPRAAAGRARPIGFTETSP